MVGYSPVEGGGVQRTTMHCHECSKSFVAELDFDTALDRLQGGLTEISMTNDATEGITAFLEKRDPDWSGK